MAPSRRSGGYMSTTWYQLKCVMVKIRSVRHSMDEISRKRSTERHRESYKGFAQCRVSVRGSTVGSGTHLGRFEYAQQHRNTMA